MTISTCCPRFWIWPGSPDPNSYALGHSIVPVIKNPSAAVKEHTVFSFDDLFFLPADLSGLSHPRDPCGRMDLCSLLQVDGSGIEYELYNIKSDPLQLKNLAHGLPARTSGKNGRDCIAH